jgi:hypothetical protein
MQLTQNFLNWRPRSKTIYFDDNEDSDFDGKKKFIKNCQELGVSWEYYTKKVSYVLNEGGFRTKSFNDIKWEDSIVVFGCSNTYGTGLCEEDNVTSLLEQKLNIPVINLGISGSAVDVAATNSLILHENYPRPKAVVHLWTQLNRYSDFNSFETNNVVGYNPYTNNYDVKLNWAERSKFYILADRALWKNQLPYFEASWFEDSAKICNINFLKTCDHARDLRHPGGISARNAAEKIAASLKAQGL